MAARSDLISDGANFRTPWLRDHIVLAGTDDLFGTVDGQTLADAAEHTGRSPASLGLGLCREGGNRVQVVLRYPTEVDMRTFLRYDHAGGWPGSRKDGDQRTDARPGQVIRAGR